MTMSERLRYKLADVKDIWIEAAMQLLVFLGFGAVALSGIGYVVGGMALVSWCMTKELYVTGSLIVVVLVALAPLAWALCREAIERLHPY